MALTIKGFRERAVQAGQNGYVEVSGLAQFSTTDANGGLDCRLQNIEEAEVFPLGPVAADESLYIDNVADIVGSMVKRPASGQLTIARTGAAKTNGLYFFFRYRGY